MENSNFTGNIANGGGSALFCYDNVTMTGCRFTNNSAPYGSGGAVYFVFNSQVTNCNFTGNSASNHGGAVYLSNDFCTGVFNDCNFADNNVSDGYGGAIYFGKNGNLKNCNFTNNSATIWGGAIYFRNPSSIAIVEECSFASNRATGSDNGGGAIMSNGNGHVKNCSFANNSAAVSGGAIILGSGTVETCSFTDNHVAGCGGAVYFYDFGNASNCSFANNSGQKGGAIYFLNDCGNVSACLFVNNSADSGVIYSDNQHDGILSVNGNIFLINNAVAIVLPQTDSNTNADFNWFGNNATDYDVAPKAENATIANWLFLNATADPASISLSQLSKVIFALYSYSKSTGNVSDYDNGQLYPAILTLTAQNGDVTDTSILGEPAAFAPASVGTGSVTARMENAECTISGIMINPDVRLNVTSKVLFTITDVYIGNVITYSVTVANNGLSNATNVTIAEILSDLVSVLGTNYDEYWKNETHEWFVPCIENGTSMTFRLGVMALKEGTAANAVCVRALENATEVRAASENVTVHRIPTQINASPVSAVWNSAKDLVITLTDAEGNPLTGMSITVSLNGEKTYVTDKNGQVRIAVGSLVP